MPVESGQLLGHYRVAEKIGEGGMGVVYRAEDTRLGRSAAIKILPEDLASDPERLARFEREARLLASLSHPNIAAIHGLEREGDLRFLALELVPGEDLAQRIRRGPIPLDEALKIASQVAAALESAHENGVIHRDLKPGNIKVSPDGRVKVLDFGLAKSFAADGSGADLTMSPTLTSPATRQGVILGTAPYMSPEQARGKAVDRRTDVWAFGCVLYEMLTRRFAFHGETVTDTFARILEREPDWSALPPETPEPIRRLLARYLTKDPDRRLKDLGYARIVIEETLAGMTSAAPGGASAGPASGPIDRAVSGVTSGVERGVSDMMRAVGEKVERELAGGRIAAAGAGARGWSTSMVAVLALAAAAAGYFGSRLQREPSPAAPAQATRASVLLPEEARTVSSATRMLALSPDGSRLAVVASKEGISQIYWRELGRRNLILLPGTEGAASLFFSPDGEWIGFWADDRLKKINLATGSIVTITHSSSVRGGAWAPDGTIYFPMTQLSGLYKVDANGGEAEPVTELDASMKELSHRWPSLLPGGKALLMNVELPGSFDIARIEAVDLRTRERHPVAEGGMSPVYSPTGHVLFVREGRLIAVPFDVEDLEVLGPEIHVPEQILSFSNSGSAQYDIARNGTLASMGIEAALHRRLVRVEPGGRVERLTQEPLALYSVALSPDGRRVALCIDNNEIWIFERDRGTLTRLTTDTATDQHPVWSPDGKWVYFGSTRAGALNLWRKPADGSGPAERVAESPNDQVPTSFSPDGRTLAYFDDSPQGGWQIILQKIEEGGDTGVFLESPFEEGYLDFSPDGKWAVFGSTEPGGMEIFVTPYPGPGGKWQISSGPSFEPRWAPDGRTIYYRTDTRILAVDFTPGDPPTVSSPRVFYDDLPGFNSLGRSFDFEPDGEAFLTLQGSAAAARVDIALNWAAELEGLAEAGRQPE